jgi:hypothetical protein
MISMVRSRAIEAASTIQAISAVAPSDPNIPTNSAAMATNTSGIDSKSIANHPADPDSPEGEAKDVPNLSTRGSPQTRASECTASLFDSRQLFSFGPKPIEFGYFVRELAHTEGTVRSRQGIVALNETHLIPKRSQPLFDRVNVFIHVSCPPLTNVASGM